MSPQGSPQAVVFGGSGFIGAHLVDRLVADGYDVTVADIAASSLAPAEHIRIESVDVRRAITLEVQNPTVVFNLAAVHRTPGHLENEYYDTNVGGAINVTRWCEAVGAERLVFTSSISVYGPTEEPKDEASELTPNSSYGRSKRLAEHIHRDWGGRGDRKLVVVRPAVVFGKGEDGNFTRLAKALQSRRFAYPGRDDTIKACGYVSDLVRSMLFGLDQHQQEYFFNYCYPRTYTIRQICETFCRVAGYSPPHLVPAIVVDGAVRALNLVPGSRLNHSFNPERIRKVTASTNVSPRALEKSGFQWETNLASGLEAWLASDPRGVFS